MKIIFVSIIIAGFLAVIFTMIKTKTLVRSIASTALQGVASLLAVNVIGLLTGVTIALNWYTLGCVSIFGIPASISFLLLDTLFR